jgi:beta-glucosidase
LRTPASCRARRREDTLDITGRKSKILIEFLIAAGVAGSFMRVHRAQEAVAPYLDPSLPIERRVDDLVSRLTLQEKVLQMQHTAPAIPRLGIPAYDWWNEALHGVARSGHATVFPQAIGMAATWDAQLVHSEGRVIATEARAKYNQAQRQGNHSIYFGLTFWSPNINIFRDPRWGRGQETYGEDPYLTGKLGLAFVTGLQGDDPKYLQTVSTPKHYAVHSGPEPRRHGFDVKVAPHDLEDTYLPAFRMTVVDGHADSVMCAYNAVDGEPACANSYLLRKTLREDWGFQGYVTSDCGAVEDITTGHHFAPDIEHGSAVAVRAGTDTTCGEEYVTLVKAVHDGLVQENDLDTALKRLFTARMRLGMFDPPHRVPFNNIPMTENDSPEHRELALRAARESMVLLKNQDGVLPLKSGIKTIAVIGPNAESLVALEGSYKGTPSHPVLPIEGMLKQFTGKAGVLYAQGSAYVAELPVPVPRTVFHTANDGKVPGLRAEYFPNTAFSGNPAVVRTDPHIQFDWDAASPARGIPRGAFGVRWTGTLTPPGPGEYTFGIEQPSCWPCKDQETFRVYLDDKLVISGHQDDRRPAIPSYKAHFGDTRPQAFRLEYTHRANLFGAGVAFVWKPPAEALRKEAESITQRADIVVAFVGLSPELEGEEMGIHVHGFNGGDRTDLGLPRVQEQLLETVASTGKPLVVVLMNGSALAVNWAEQHAAAVLEAWYPGEEGGRAIAETLAGTNNPAGRLPVTFYASLDQLPPFDDYSMKNRTYRYFRGKPLYEFGYGLSYSKFVYANLKLSPHRLEAGQPLEVEAEVRNTSETAGEEVVELYLSKKEGAPDDLIRALRGFARVQLVANSSRHVSFSLAPRDLSVVTENGDHVILPGAYEVLVGGGQKAESASGVAQDFEITGQVKLPR